MIWEIKYNFSLQNVLKFLKEYKKFVPEKIISTAKQRKQLYDGKNVVAGRNSNRKLLNHYISL